MINLIDQKIRDAFSDAALHYDVLTSLHKEIGRELTRKIAAHDPCAAVLDIGMGTGWFTRRLTDTFPDALVVGLDFAPGMIAQAKDGEGTFKIVQADASCLPFKAQSFDLITSNLAYQWIADLPRAFGLCRTALKRSGRMSLTMFGHDTFQELFEVLNLRTARRLAGPEQVVDALHAAGFANPTVDAERIKVRFPDMMGLVKWIKDIGANALPKDVYPGKELLFKANAEYNARFRDRLGVYATFEVIWVEAGR